MFLDALAAVGNKECYPLLFLVNMITEFNYTLYNILDFTLTQTPPSVLYGDIPSAYYATGNVSYYDSISNEYITRTNISIGFDSYEWLNPQHTNCTFTFSKYKITSYNIEQQYWEDWVSIKDKFEYTTSYGRHDYIAKDLYLQPVYDGADA